MSCGPGGGFGGGLGGDGLGGRPGRLFGRWRLRQRPWGGRRVRRARRPRTWTKATSRTWRTSARAGVGQARSGGRRRRGAGATGPTSSWSTRTSARPRGGEAALAGDRLPSWAASASRAARPPLDADARSSMLRVRGALAPALLRRRRVRRGRARKAARSATCPARCDRCAHVAMPTPYRS